MTTFAIVDDTAIWFLIVEEYLAKMGNSTVIAKAQDGIEFVDWCYHNKNLPDIAIVDVEMPKMDGVQLTDFLTEYFPSIKVIAASSHIHQEIVEDMIGCGAYAFVSKLYGIKNLSNAIDAVTVGEVYIDPLLLLETIDRDQLMKDRKKHKRLYDTSALTSKQKALAALYATGASQKEIAGSMDLSQSTVENNTNILTEKLEIENRQHLTLNSIRNGFSRIAKIFKKG